MSRLSSVLTHDAVIAAAVACLSITAQAASAEPSQTQRASGSAMLAGVQATAPAPRIVYEDYPVPADLAYALLPGDPGVVSNGPVPDTPANRARYGEPLSHAGRSSLPSGD